MSQIGIEMSDEVAQELYRRAPDPKNRHQLVEAAFRKYFAEGERENELELLNSNAEALNREAEDVLSYQVYFEKS